MTNGIAYVCVCTHIYIKCVHMYVCAIGCVCVCVCVIVFLIILHDHVWYVQLLCSKLQCVCLVDTIV